jgi:hypothetical protein
MAPTNRAVANIDAFPSAAEPPLQLVHAIDGQHPSVGKDLPSC